MSLDLQTHQLKNIIWLLLGLQAKPVTQGMRSIQQGWTIAVTLLAAPTLHLPLSMNHMTLAHPLD